MKRLFIYLLITMCSTSLFAQFSTSFETSISMSKIGVGYDFNKKIWTTVSLYGGMKAEDLTVDAAFRYNFIAKEFHDFYGGVGGIFNTINGMILPIGVRFRPLTDFKNLSFQLELMPTIDFEASSNLLFFCSIGIRYQFGMNR